MTRSLIGVGRGQKASPTAITEPLTELATLPRLAFSASSASPRERFFLKGFLASTLGAKGSPIAQAAPVRVPLILTRRRGGRGENHGSLSLRAG